MNLETAFPSKYLKASDLPEGQTKSFIIESIEIEEIGREKQTKPVFYFVDEDKGLVVNKTNLNSVKKLYGTTDSDELLGKQIRLYSTEVQFGDEMVESIRISIKPSKSTPAPARPALAKEWPKEDADDDSVPFN